MIAVYVNENGFASGLDEKGSVKLYEKYTSGWRIEREISFTISQTEGIAQTRRNIEEMVRHLDTCKVFVAKEVIGQLYYVLEINGFEIFEVEGEPKVFLDSIEEAVAITEQEKEKVINQDSITYFDKTDQEGYYLLNLKKALKLDCSLSSKKLLLPFLRKKEFTKLEIICDHLPRWFETELKALELTSEVSEIWENELKVSVFH